MADASVAEAHEGGQYAARHRGSGCRGSRRGGGAMRIAPGHSIDILSVHEKLAVFDALSMQGVLSAAEGSRLSVRKYEDSVDEGYFENREDSDRYKAARARKDWSEADRLLLDALVRDRVGYRTIMDSEETMHAFSA